jgi:hypothetical protein
MPNIGDLFKSGSTAEQFLIWGVLQQLLQPLLSPATNELGKIVNQGLPSILNTPADAAASVARGLDNTEHAELVARESGLESDAFAMLIQLAMRSADLGTAIAAYQRGLIPDGSANGAELSLNGALADSGIRQEWHNVIKQLAIEIPSTAEVMNAWLEGQIGESEARERYLKAGGDPTWFQTAYNANGQAPTPNEALTMVNRGIIPLTGTGPGAVTYEQAFLEGPWRNKWLSAFEALREYYPPPRTVTAMYHQGQLTHDQAATYLVKQGLSTDLAAAYLAPKASTATDTEKHLAKTDIVTLYADGLMTRTDAVKALEAIKYSAHDASLILELQDVRTAAKQVTAGMTRVRTLFDAGKMTAADAVKALIALDVDATQARELVDTWQITVVSNPRSLTESQIVNAWYYELVSADDAMDMLVSIGYEPGDAWLLLAIKNRGPVKGLARPE